MTQSSLQTRIKKIQGHIGVAADGIIGPSTVTALENTLFPPKAEILQTASMSVSQKRIGPDSYRDRILMPFPWCPVKRDKLPK